MIKNDGGYKRYIVCRREIQEFSGETSRPVVHAKEFNRRVLKDIYAKILHVLF